MSKDKQKRLSFFYSPQDQPHRQRCKEILEKHPEVVNLFGRNPKTFLILLFILVLQTGIAWWMGELTIKYWWFSLILAYCVGAFANHALYTIIHEGTHNLIFKKRLFNKFAVILADLPNVIPGAMGFRKYHLKHHAQQGDYEQDADLASRLEARIIGNSPWRKALWLMLFPFFTIIHTFHVKNVNVWYKWMFINLLVVFAWDFAIVYFLGWNALLYLFLSLIFGLGLHPLGARWIQEHYTLDENQETYSYYGPLNFLSLNVGYHNEHHDFPAIPWNRLPELKKIAPEYYETLIYHKSWTKLLFSFIFKQEYSLYSRVLRK